MPELNLGGEYKGFGEAKCGAFGSMTLTATGFNGHTTLLVKLPI
jgi:hypothetical protein